VMVHVKFHKGQQQTGRYKENVRFLAHPVGELTTIVKCDRVDHIYLQPETGLGLYPNKVDPI
jgi:hypothetical protein